MLALDIGTSGTRAALFNERGDQIDGSFVSMENEEYTAFVSGNDVSVDALVSLVAAVLDRAVERTEELVSRVDYVAAHKWFNLAAMQGNKDATRMRVEIAAEMSKTEIAAAQRAARDWLTRH